LRHLSVFLFAVTALAGDFPLPGANHLVLRVSESGLGGGKARPVIEVLSDGSLRHKGKLAATRMTKRELQDLLRFAVETHKFFQYDEPAVNRTLKAREPGPHCGTGYTTTHVLIAILGKRKEFGVGLLVSKAITHADIEDLAHLYAIERRLHLEVKLAQSGGRAKVMGYLKEANLRLKQRYPKLKPFAIEEFSGLRDVPKGEMILPANWDPNFDKISGKCAGFTRRVPGRIISATVRTDPKAKPRAAAQVQS